MNQACCRFCLRLAALWAASLSCAAGLHPPPRPPQPSACSREQGLGCHVDQLRCAGQHATPSETCIPIFCMNAQPMPAHGRVHTSHVPTLLHAPGLSDELGALHNSSQVGAAGLQGKADGQLVQCWLEENRRLLHRQ